jgi:DNA invertase Pin-like site-specific DNA recombinase
MSELVDFAIYCRISTANQNIETQLREAQEYCRRNGVVNYKTYADVGVSGMKDTRPQLDSMLRDLRAGQIRCILIYKLDRLGRSLPHLLDLLGEFRNQKVRLISIADGLDTQTDNPMSRAFWKLLGVFAELEREIIRERIMSGLERVKNSGKKLGRPAGSKDKGQRSRSGYHLRYAGRSKEQRRLGKRMTVAVSQGESNDPVAI